ncbi:MAG: hypothetical protein WD098_04960 [Balneolales bacterium]
MNRDGTRYFSTLSSQDRKLSLSGTIVSCSQTFPPLSAQRPVLLLPKPGQTRRSAPTFDFSIGLTLFFY